MKLSKMLYNYSKSSTLSLTINAAKYSPRSYIFIREFANTYIIEPGPSFSKYLGQADSSIILDKHLRLIKANCRCLEFYRNEECVHVTALFAIALMVLNPETFKVAQKEYDLLVLQQSHNKIMERLSYELKRANAFQGMVHLIPVIDASTGFYYLSLKIGIDKDYVVKDIGYFIHLMENQMEYSYGQKLSFVHSYECLDERSKGLYNYLTNVVKEDESKNISLSKAQLLTLLELYQTDVINYVDKRDSKPTPRRIIKTDDISLVLNSNELFISAKGGSKPLICGINYAYFVDDDAIYSYSYKSTTERKIFESLFKVSGHLMIDANSEGFIADLLPIIKNNVEILDDFYEKYPVPEIYFNSFISYENSNIYLKTSVNASDKDSPYFAQLEKNYYSVIEGFYFAKNNMGVYNICNIENQYKFLTSDISALKSFGEVYFDKSIKNLKTRKSGKVTVNISYGVDLLDFRFEDQNLTIEEIQAILIGYHQKKHFVKLKDDTIIEIDENEAKKIDDFLEDFNISIKDLASPVSKPINYILKLIDSNDRNVNLDNKVYQMVKAIQDYKNSAFNPISPFDRYLRPYQIEGFKWLKTLASYGFGGILADDMGLGKTLEIISFIASDIYEKPSLIVCPMSLVYNWEIECEKWGLQLPVKIILGNAIEREAIINSINQNKKMIYITSYDSLRRDIGIYANSFRFVIADEAQFIKNQFTQKSEAVKSLKSDIRFALTGTPVENGLADLWSIFDFLMPGYLSNYSHFKNRYESLILHQDDETLELLSKRVSPFILRRTKKDVLKELPDKIEDYYYIKMDNKQKEVYSAYVEKIKKDISETGGNNVLALITRLRQICITPELLFDEKFENTKIDMAVDLIASSIEGGHKILLFSQFSQSFPILSRHLDDLGIRYFILDGTTKAKSRIEMANEFNENPEIKVFIISLKAGGTGLNLTGADMVIHLDPWWNLSAENQATDRAYRIGQNKDVYVLKLICKDTIEERVVKLQQVKKELADSIVHSEEAQIRLNKNDILELLD